VTLWQASEGKVREVRGRCAVSTRCHLSSTHISNLLGLRLEDSGQHIRVHTDTHTHTRALHDPRIDITAGRRTDEDGGVPLT
jgi:hypothetical protein